MLHHNEDCRTGTPGRLLAVVAVVFVVSVAGCTKPVGTSPAPDVSSSSMSPLLQTLGPPPQGFGSWIDVFELQGRMDAAADRISAAAGAGTGLAGIVAAPETKHLTVYWKGELPAETRQLVDEIRTSLPVEVLPGQYSATELTEISRSVATAPGVVSVGGNVDGSGITATVDADVNADSWGISVPVRVERGERPTLVACSRQDACSPWIGGATYRSPNYACTTGFAVATSSQEYLLAAAHCAQLGDGVQDPTGEKIGSVVADDDSRDTLLIQHTPTTLVQGKIFIGPWNSSTSVTIKGASRAYVGNYICSAGAFTGGNCKLKVDALYLTINYGNGLVVWPMSRAVQLNGAAAVGLGDSGGPMHYVKFTIQGAVLAQTEIATGTISGGAQLVPCPAGSPSPRCFSTVVYADIATTLSFYKASIVTG